MHSEPFIGDNGAQQATGRRCFAVVAAGLGALGVLGAVIAGASSGAVAAALGTRGSELLAASATAGWFDCTFVARVCLALNFLAIAPVAAQHVFKKNSNTSEMGWTCVDTMEEKGRLCIIHIFGLIGSYALAMALINLWLAVAYNGCYALVWGVYATIASALSVAMQFYKPSGTGDPDSPRRGPIPIIVVVACLNPLIAIFAAAGGGTFYAPMAAGLSNPFAIGARVCALLNVLAVMPIAFAHILKRSSNAPEMGWTCVESMEEKGRLGIIHGFSIVGSYGGALSICHLWIVVCYSSCAACVLGAYGTIASVFLVSMQFYKPSGTGDSDSPATGPIPVIIAINCLNP
eukprot:CAMPEP_0117459580 /NCGR_PEP_ID=MMETSP0784-20121206/1555_1 /TAXON_ID=39447 /ORGANISM="" /LENGTH=346 /DNA_ID=CAMNT_0005253205 /DNA_START=28 /DNA_END=1065 /DNA_ORIENTATION=+